MKILVVDDDPIVLESCKRILEAENFGVLLVPSVDKALEVMEEQGVRLLLVDVKIPGRDGMYLMREVKRKWPSARIIVMSGYPTPETISDCAKFGAATFIPKPFTPDELLDAVYQLLGKEESREITKSARDR